MFLANHTANLYQWIDVNFSFSEKIMPWLQIEEKRK